MAWTMTNPTRAALTMIAMATAARVAAVASPRLLPVRRHHSSRSRQHPSRHHPSRRHCGRHHLDRRRHRRRGPRRPHPRPRPSSIDLTIPLATLLGPRRRPGESHGFGPLDPALCRALAALAAASPHTTACVTVTDPNGHAIGHGCLTAGRRKARLPGAPDPPLTALPARLNLTITATRLTQLLHPPRQPRPGTGQPRPPGPAPRSGWALTPPAQPQARTTPRTSPATRPGAGPGPSPCPAACSTPSRSSPSPPTTATTAANHTPTSPTTPSATWSRSATTSAPCRPAPAHAKESDFEHAVPYDQGGRTCACNAGARSRACHQVKQSPGWKVTQPKPGWHQWETPSGRTYTQEPKRYPT